MLTKLCGVIPVVSLAVAAMSCGGELDDSELDRYLCNQEMFGEDVRESARGELTVADLQRLGEGEGQAPVGAVSAKFALYTSALPRPPFDPPGDIVCQAVEFESEGAAEQWVEGLRANSRLDGIVVGFLADGGATTEERVLQEFREAAAGSSLRVFTAQPGHQRDMGFVTMAVGNEGRFVRVTAFSGERYIDPQTDQVVQWWLDARPR